MKTLEAISATRKALEAGVDPTVILTILLSDGFPQERAATIIRWGIVFLRKKSAAPKEDQSEDKQEEE